MTRRVERRGSEAASLGTMAHAVAHHLLAWPSIPILPGSEFAYDDHGERKTEIVEREMLKYVDVYVEHVRKRSKESGGRLYLEQHVKLDRVVRDGMFGTADAVIDDRRASEVVIIDFKYGFTPVRVVEEDDVSLEDVPNAQLMYYAVGALDMFDWVHRHAVLEIVQPRCMEVPTVQFHRVSAAAARRWAENDLWRAAHAATSEDAPLVAGDHCRFCPALDVCPAVRHSIQSLAVQDFAEVADGEADRRIDMPDDAERLAEVLRWAPVIDAWLKACEETALELMRNGHRVPGFKLVAKRSNRRWPTNDPAELAKALRREGLKLTPKMLIAEPKILSPAQLEDAIGEKYSDAINAVAVKPDAGVTVAAESNRRDAVEPGGDFDELAGEDLEDLI